MLYREIIAVCSEIHTKHINTLCGQNVQFVSVKRGGTYSDPRALKGLIPSLSLQQYFGFTLFTSKPHRADVWPNSVVVTYSKTCRTAVARQRATSGTRNCCDAGEQQDICDRSRLCCHEAQWYHLESDYQIGMSNTLLRAGCSGLRWELGLSVLKINIKI